MALTMLWQEEAPGRVRSEKLDGLLHVTCLVEEEPPPAPVADFAATPLSGVAPLTVRFTDRSTGSVTSWAWDFENNGVTDSTAQNPRHAYTSPGTYTVKLVVTGPGGSSTSLKERYITVEPPSPPPPTPPPLEDVPPPPTPTRNSYYVAPNGDDGKSGSLSQPWRTIQHALRQVSAGDAIYLRSGTYRQGQIVIDSSCATGTASNPILLIGYPGEAKPIIDGEYRYPTGAAAGTGVGGRDYVYGGLVEFTHNRSYYTLYGLAVTGSRGRALRSYQGSHGITITWCDFYRNRSSATQLGDGDYHTYQWNDCWHNENYRELGTIDGSWAPCVNLMEADNCLVHHNSVHECWGEGIQVCGNDNVVRDNLVYNVYNTSIYVLHSQRVVVERNLVYHTGDPAFVKPNGYRGAGIRMGAEYKRESVPMTDVIIRNNIVFGCHQNLSICIVHPGNNPTFADILIANNTCVNAVGDTWIANVYVASDVAPSNVAWKNNIFLQDTRLAPQAAGKSSGMTWDYNLWRPAPGSGWQGSHDVYQNPLLVDDDTEAMRPGEVEETSFQLQASSPAQGKGSTLSQITDDYFGNRRTVPYDIGAHERSG